MPPAVSPTTTFDDLHRIVFKTRSALRHRGQADLLENTKHWADPIEPLRARLLANAEKRIDIEAQRMVASENLAKVADKVSDRLLEGVEKDRKDPRYTHFFSIAPSDFNKLGLDVRALEMRGWLASTDPVIVALKDVILAAVEAAEVAVIATKASEQATAEVEQARREYAAQLTGWRDELHEILSKRARDQKLGRGWAGLFFKL